MEPLFQKIEIEEGRLFVVKNNVVRHFNNVFHFHPEYEITFLNRGSGQCLMGDRFVNFNEGDLFFLGPNFPHSWRSDHTSKQSHSLVIQLNHQLWKGGILNAREMEGICKLLSFCSRGIKFNPELSKNIGRQMFEVLSQDKTRGLLTILDILYQLSESEHYEMMASPAFRSSAKQTDYLKINKAYQFVQENFQKEIELSDVASLINMTPSGFCRYFKKITRQTFFSYLNEYKVGIACRLLSEPEFNITEISYKSGFQSISNFNKQFKLITGDSPKDYRKKRKHLAKVIS